MTQCLIYESLHPRIIAVRPSTIFDLQSSYFLSKFPSRPRWVTNAAKTSHSSVMTRAHHYRIITPVTRSVMLRGNDRAGISASWKGQRIVFRRRGGRRYRTGMTCRSRRNDPEHARSNVAERRSQFPGVASVRPRLLRKTAGSFLRSSYSPRPEDLGRGSGSFAWQGPKLGRMTDSRYRARRGLVISSW